METGYESDSDFYGQAETIDRLRERVRHDAEGVHGQVVVRTEARPRVKEEPDDEEKKPMGHISEHTSQPALQHQLHNPFAGVSYAWQLGESVRDFVARLPPRTTVMDDETPWIYVCNPHADGKENKASAGNQMILGCEDEGPEPEGAQTELFAEGGKERLELLGNFLTGLAGIARMRMPRSAAVAEMEAARQSAARDILGLASHLGVTCGKWMLFVPPQTVNAVWDIIVHATVRNELGIAAKVAPRDPSLTAARQQTRERLICIYTADFRDRRDVGRVLLRLEALGLVPQHGDRIYYKCDAYTYLGIGAQNPWGIRASLFSSADIFAYMHNDAAGMRE